jgi:hypothetical protein
MRGGAGQPVLFLHGGGGLPSWLPFLAQLAEKFDLLVPEHPGFGQSEMPDWLDSVSDLANFYLIFSRSSICKGYISLDIRSAAGLPPILPCATPAASPRSR